MGQVPKISSTGSNALERRLPDPCDGVDVNFCRNPHCGSYGVHPDPFKRQGQSVNPADPPHGSVEGGKDKEFFKCPECNTTSHLKNNTAIVEEYRRLNRLQTTIPAAAACKTQGCFAHGMSVDDHLEFYWRFGSTAKGDPRWRCKLCKSTFSSGRPARRQRRSDKNRLIFQMFCNDLSPAKISKIAEISYRYLYKRIDFFHDQIRGFTAERQDLSLLDLEAVGSRFATDSQTLSINWPTRRERTPVMV